MSQFYDQASLVMVPSGYKNGKVYSQKPLSADGELTFTRASTATRVNASGLIESVASGVPRLDYSGGASCPSLLLEPQRTNLVTYSEQFDNADWVKTDATVTANAASSPDGYTNAESILDNLTSGQPRIGNTISSSIATGQTVAISFFAKKNTHDWCQVTSGGQTNDQWASFNLATGIIGNTSASANAKIEDYGNGWYRLSITATTTANNAILASILALTNNTNANTRLPSYVGSGGGVYIYGCQMEAGSYATSYIPTLASAVSRNADSASKTGISSLIGQTAGTLFLDFTISSPDDAAAKWICFLKGAAGNYIGIYTNGGNKFIAEVAVATAQFLNQSVSVVLGKRYKMALAYKQNDFAFYVDGVQIATDSSGSVPACGEFSYLYNTSSFNVGTLEHNQTLLFKTRLTNAQLAELTTL